MLVRSLPIVLLTALAGGCADEPPDGGFAGARLPTGPHPDVYRGVFPCDNCAGIDTTLWLLADGTFFWRQRYPDDADGPTTSAHALGRWQVDADGLLVLRGAGPARRFEVAGTDQLVMITPSALEHRLSREPGAPAFEDPVRIEGIATVEDGHARITECRTGLAASASGAELPQLVRQYRGLGYRGKPAFVELVARFEWSADGTLSAFAIERFVTIKPNRTC